MSVIAFLSMDTSALEDFFVYDEMLIPHFNAHGYEVETVAWRDESVDWNRFSHVIVRSPWDYQQDPDGFIACLERIEASQATLHNPLSLMKWNIEKTYLQALESQGVPVVPTVAVRRRDRSAQHFLWQRHTHRSLRHQYTGCNA